MTDLATHANAAPAEASAPGEAAGAVVAQLRGRGLLGADTPVTVTPLPGGVSSDIVAVCGPGVDLVVKRALPRLRVAEEWLADPARLAVEAHAMTVAATLIPGAVAPLLDHSDGYLVMGRIPSSWTNWRDDLLTGEHLDHAGATAARLGALLSTLHRASATDDILTAFADRTVFHELRIDPFYRVTGDRNPDLAPAIGATVERMLARRDCLVHGDFSPKNILVHPDGAVVLDWEVAHAGDPTFDVAFLLCHLLLKAVHRPDAATVLVDAGRAFLAAYTVDNVDGGHLARQVGCLLLSRVDGRSPAAYLTPSGRQRARALGAALLTKGEPDISYAWQEVC